jgi:hypothetical protein
VSKDDGANRTPTGHVSCSIVDDQTTTSTIHQLTSSFDNCVSAEITMENARTNDVQCASCVVLVLRRWRSHVNGFDHRCFDILLEIDDHHRSFSCLCLSVVVVNEPRNSPRSTLVVGCQYTVEQFIVVRFSRHIGLDNPNEAVLSSYTSLDSTLNYEIRDDSSYYCQSTLKSLTLGQQQICLLHADHMPVIIQGDCRYRVWQTNVSRCWLSSRHK